MLIIPSDPAALLETVHHARTRPARRVAALLALAAAALATAPAAARGPLQVLWSHPANSQTVAFSPDSGALATGGGSDTNLWRADDGAFIETFHARFDDANSVAFSPDGRYLAEGAQSFNQNLNLFNVADASIVVERITAHSNGTESVAFAPDGRFLATGGRDAEAKLWSVPDLTLIRSFASGKRTFGVAFSPDGSLLLAGGTHGVSLWRVADGSLVRWFDTGAIASSVAFSPDGSTVAAGFDSTDQYGQCSECSVKLWRASDGALLHTLSGPGTISVISLAFSPDGGFLASGGDGGQYDPETQSPAYFGILRFWRVADGALLDEFDLDAGIGDSAVMSVAFSRDGDLFAYTRLDGLTTVALNPFAGATGCAADLTGDGVVDFSDYLEFLNFYEALDTRADFNGDGTIDFSDYLEFLNQYDAGC